MTLASLLEPLTTTATAPPYAPDLGDVGAILRARTLDSNGVETGTFNSDTRPTGSETERLIAQATDDVTDQTGIQIPSALWRPTRSVIAYRAAMLVELSYFPEQVGAGKSPYPQYEALYADALTRLIAAAREAASGEAPGVGDDPGFAVYSFGGPMLQPGIGMRTVW